eukprot:7315518-Prymnesium_polylepis.1
MLYVRPASLNGESSPLAALFEPAPFSNAHRAAATDWSRRFRSARASASRACVVHCFCDAADGFGTAAAGLGARRGMSLRHAAVFFTQLGPLPWGV